MTAFLNLLIPLAAIGGLYWLIIRWDRKRKVEAPRYPSATAKRIAPVVPLDECENKISE